MPTQIIAVTGIEQKIFYIRRQKVMVDRDLAQLYGVSTKVLNQAVKRNKNRFPADFAFRLTNEEKKEVVTNCDHLQAIRFSPQLPTAFTEQGIAMLSTVLKSERAIQVNIAIMRAFVKIREILATHKELAERLSELERHMDKKDQEIIALFEAIRALMAPLPEPPKESIGFRPR